MEKDSLSDDEMIQVKELIIRTNKENPKEDDIQSLRILLDNHPQLWRCGGDLAVKNQIELVNLPGVTAASRELVVAGLVEMRKLFSYNDSPILEQMVIEQILLSWLRLNLWEGKYTNESRQGMSLEKATFWEKRLSTAQRRYLRACESLARIRRLARNIPSLQLNIAAKDGQQVNFAGDFVKHDG
jgi:hypothetical protein